MAYSWKKCDMRGKGDRTGHTGNGLGFNKNALICSYQVNIRYAPHWGAGVSI